tara:strand:- start:709 stop:936 length:228 start_codon:yes stop_codon:yes gene_type:complete
VEASGKQKAIIRTDETDVLKTSVDTPQVANNVFASTPSIKKNSKVIVIPVDCLALCFYYLQIVTFATPEPIGAKR